MVIAKSRVAPLKKLTLPQLELMAASTGATLTNFVQQALKQRYDSVTVTLWTDSEIVLHWLHSDKPLKPFIPNRVREIKESYPTTHSNHCPTKSNTADQILGISAQQFHTSTVWQHGPEWLSQPSLWSSWNPSHTLTVNIVEPDGSEPHTTTKPAIMGPKTNGSAITELSLSTNELGMHLIIDVSRYSSLGKLLSVTAYVLHFIQIIKK